MRLFFPKEREESCGPERQPVRASFSALTSQTENIGISTISSLITGPSLPNWSFKVQLTVTLAQQKIEETQRLAECFFLHNLTNIQYSARLPFHLHSSRKTIYFNTFPQTTGLWDVRCRNDCFILISCGCNKHFPTTPCRHFIHEKENEDEISQEAEKEMAMSPDQNSLSIPSYSLYSTCPAWIRERLKLNKPMIINCEYSYIMRVFVIWQRLLIVLNCDLNHKPCRVLQQNDIWYPGWSQW